MPARWEESDRAGRVIAHLDELSGVDEDGAITYDDFGESFRFDMGVEVLVGLAELREDLPQSERQRIVRRGVIEAKKADNLTAGRVIEEIEDQQVAFVRRPEQRYVLLTSLSFRYFAEFANVQAYDARMTFTRHIPGRFERPDRAVRATKRDPYRIPSQFTTVRVHVRAQNEADAVDAALDRLNFIRGLWNFALTFGRRRQTLELGNKPANDIVPGPIHTLHKPDGSPATEIFWWQPNHSPDLLAKNIQSKYEGMKEWERWARDRVSRAVFEDDLRQLVVQYVQALDEADVHSAYLRLWGVLEGLTALNKTDPLTVAVDRTVMLFKDPEYEALVLNRLREVRNDIVHRGHDSEHAESLVYALKNYVDTVLYYLLTSADEWTSMQDFGAFLALAKKADVLRKRPRYELALDLLSAT